MYLSLTNHELLLYLFFNLFPRILIVLEACNHKLNKNCEHRICLETLSNTHDCVLLQHQILPINILRDLGKVPEKHVVINMLKCWRNGGPASIRDVLTQNGVRQHDSLLSRARPGLLVPTHLLDSVKWGGLEPFQLEEIVAVAADQDDVNSAEGPIYK